VARKYTPLKSLIAVNETSIMILPTQTGILSLNSSEKFVILSRYVPPIMGGDIQPGVTNALAKDGNFLNDHGELPILTIWPARNHALA
jgi:uncharacterized protein YjlB